MAAFPAATNKTVTGADGNLSAGTKNALPAEKPSWRDPLHRLLFPALHSFGIRALRILSKPLHERFDKIEPARREMEIRVWVIMATFLVLALAVPPLLLVYFMGQQMAQVWGMAATLCFYVFFILLLCVWRNWRRYVDFFCLSYGLLLVYFAASVIGPPRAAIFVLHLATAWAAGYVAFYLAVHRHPKGTEEAIDALPSPSYHSNKTAKELIQAISIGLFVVAALWTALVPAILFGQSMTKALDIVFVLSYMCWIHAALWIACSYGQLMSELPLLFFKDPLPPLPLPSLLVACVIASPIIVLLSAVLSVLFQWLLLVALVAFLGYSIAVYLHRELLADRCYTKYTSYGE